MADVYEPDSASELDLLGMPEFKQIVSSMIDTLVLAFEDDFADMFATIARPESSPHVRAARARRASLRPRGENRGEWFSMRRGDRRRYVIAHVHYRSDIAADYAAIREALAASDALQSEQPWKIAAADTIAVAAAEGALVVRRMEIPSLTLGFRDIA